VAGSERQRVAAVDEANTLPGEKGKIVRLAMPMNKVRVFQNEVMILFSLALFLVPFFAIIITFFFTKYGIYEEKKKPSIPLGNTGGISRSELHAH
jgi:hypothetical protein